MGLTNFLFFNKFHKVSKNLGTMKRAISDLLDSGSSSTEKALTNAEIEAFHPYFKIIISLILDYSIYTINNLSKIFTLTKRIL